MTAKNRKKKTGKGAKRNGKNKTYKGRNKRGNKGKKEEKDG